MAVSSTRTITLVTALKRKTMGDFIPHGVRVGIPTRTERTGKMPVLSFALWLIFRWELWKALDLPPLLLGL